MLSHTVFTEALSWFKHLLTTLSNKKSLGHLLIVAMVVTLASGLVLYIIDPNIHSPLDGIWSAWVTMTHVGFGDVVPVSFLGRLLAAALILFGLGLFSLFTATLSVALIGRNVDAVGHGVQRIEQEAERIESGENRILQELARLHERMQALEKQLSLRPTRDGE